MEPTRKPALLQPDQGRAYAMGRMRAVFKADAPDGVEGYSISEWWLEPQTRGPGVHSHPEDHVYYIVAGTVSLHLDGVWSDLPAGGYALIPGGTPHDFQNRSAAAAGFISFNAPGDFEHRVRGPNGIAAALAGEDLRLS